MNLPGELGGGVLELIRAHRDRLEQCVPLVDALRTMLLTPPPEVRETINHSWRVPRDLTFRLADTCPGPEAISSRQVTTTPDDRAPRHTP